MGTLYCLDYDDSRATRYAQVQTSEIVNRKLSTSIRELSSPHPLFKLVAAVLLLPREPVLALPYNKHLPLMVNRYQHYTYVRSTRQQQSRLR